MFFFVIVCFAYFVARGGVVGSVVLHYRRAVACLGWVGLSWCAVLCSVVLCRVSCCCIDDLGYVVLCFAVSYCVAFCAAVATFAAAADPTSVACADGCMPIWSLLDRPVAPLLLCPS